MIRGTEGHYDLILRTGAWGRDIIVPAAIGRFGLQEWVQLLWVADIGL